MGKPVSQQVGGSFGDHNGVLQQGPVAFTENIAAVCEKDFANGEMLKSRNGSKVLHDVKILIAAYHSWIAAVPELLLKGLSLQTVRERLNQSAHRSYKLMGGQGSIERAREAAPRETTSVKALVRDFLGRYVEGRSRRMEILGSLKAVACGSHSASQEP
jgi:putative NADH-flavin reductase